MLRNADDKGKTKRFITRAIYPIHLYFSRNPRAAVSFRPGPNAAPLMCRTKLNKVQLRSDFGATVDSDGVRASNLIREACGKQFSMTRYAF